MSDLLRSSAWSTIHYPSAALALEKHGFFPYERFAYDALRIATDAFSAADLSCSISVTFDPHEMADPWALNAWVRENDGDFVIESTAFTPPVLLALCRRIAHPLFDQQGVLTQWQATPALFRQELSEIATLIVNAGNAVRKDGLGTGLRDLRDGGGYSLENLRDFANHFDASVQFIVNHEAAHAYVRQFEHMQRATSDLDRQAFEFLADLVATSWMYSRFIVNTPDTEAYRRYRGFRTHSQATRANTVAVLQAQLVVLLFFGLAEALENDGRITYEGGPTHPHTFVRYLLQQIHFMTLVLSNYKSSLTRRHVRGIDDWWKSMMSLFGAVGLLPPRTQSALTNDGSFAAVRRAGELAADLDVVEVRKAVPFLRSLMAMSGEVQPDRASTDVILRLAKIG